MSERDCIRDALRTLLAREDADMADLRMISPRLSLPSLSRGDDVCK
jgi:hypothetical protein